MLLESLQPSKVRRHRGRSTCASPRTGLVTWHNPAVGPQRHEPVKFGKYVLFAECPHHARMRAIYSARTQADEPASG